MSSEEYKEINEFFAARKAKEQKRRMDYAISKLNDIGIMPNYKDCSLLEFEHNENLIKYFPHSGWFTGKSVKDGRGIKNLLKQLI